MLKPSTEADMTFSFVDITAECRNYGRVCAVGSPDPSRCFATGIGVEVAAVGEQSTVSLQTMNYNNQPCMKDSTNSINCELVSEIVGTKSRDAAIERKEQSQYEICYQPTTKGQHQLHIKIGGLHIKESPFLVFAKLPVQRLGIPILTTGGVNKPEGVAINRR